jgi:hypothetical protein
MKNLFTLILLILSTSVSAQNVKLYKDLSEGLLKKEAKKIIKSNKGDYNEINIGNGFQWTLKTTGLLYGPYKGLRVIWLWPKGSLMSGSGYDRTVSYLNATKSFFESRDWTVLLKNDYWNAPQNFTSKGYLYGLVMLSPDEKRVIHLYPEKVMPLGCTENSCMTEQAYMKLMSKSWWDKLMNDSEAQKDKDTSKTDF